METTPLPKSYDLNILENYISEHIKFVDIQHNETTDSSNPAETSTGKINLDTKATVQNDNEKISEEKPKKSTKQTKEENEDAEHPVEKNNVCKINVIEHVVIKSTTNLNNAENDVKKMDLDPFMVATQKLPESRNNSNCEDKLYDNYPTIDDRGFVNPTQKLNLNITEEEEQQQQQHTEYNEPEEDLNIFLKSQTDILETLEHTINTCINSITNISRVELKKKFKFLSEYVKKLKNISKSDKIETSVQTNPIQTVDKTIETMTNDRCHQETQTDIEIIDRGVQTTLNENSYSQNNSEQFANEAKSSCLRINLVDCITQGTKNALESLWSEPDISVSNTMKEIRQTKMPTTDFSNVSPPPPRKQKTQNEVFTAGFDNVNFDTQEVARKVLDGKMLLSRNSEDGNASKDMVKCGNYENGSPCPPASKVSVCLTISIVVLGTSIQTISNRIIIL